MRVQIQNFLLMRTCLVIFISEIDEKQHELTAKVDKLDDSSESEKLKAALQDLNELKTEMEHLKNNIEDKYENASNVSHII